MRSRMTDAISIRRIVRRTLAIYVGQARVLLALAAVVVVIVAVLDTTGLARGVPVLGILVFIALIVVFALFTGTVVQVTANAYEDRPAMTVGELVSTVRPALGELVLVEFVAFVALTIFYSLLSLLLLALTVGTLVGINAAGAGTHVGSIAVIAVMGVLVLLAPGAYLLTVWSVALPVVVLERPGGLRALKRSRELVYGNRLRVLALAVAFWLLAGLGVRVLELASRTAGQTPGVAIALLASILLAPIPLLGATTLYFELRPTPTTDTPATRIPPHPSAPQTSPGAIATGPDSLRP